MSQAFQVIGLDPSLRNWGIAKGTLVWGATPQLTIHDIDVIQPVLSTGKQVRQNSKDLESAYQLSQGTMAAVQGAQAVFVEVPVGSQSARAMASYGICVGVLGALRAHGIPFFEVSPNEVKLATVGKKTASKAEMIAWAYQVHPNSNWPTYTKNGQLLLSEAKAEHMADAIAAIYAGIKSQPFQQLLPFLQAA